ncbi:hypothetical protein DEH18_30320 [Streptomyces sp. NHF165]|nr:hypothetical protein DEH18_30320 [Streptomyces sp. NHF165]
MPGSPKVSRAGRVAPRAPAATDRRPDGARSRHRRPDTARPSTAAGRPPRSRRGRRPRHTRRPPAIRW